jgi:2,3-dihydroxybiphenyl 1,2-dioxygenase
LTVPRAIEVAYLGVEVADRRRFGAFVSHVVGLVPGEPTSDGSDTWRNDGAAHRVLVTEGPANDARVLGFEAVDRRALDGVIQRLERAGFAPAPGTMAERTARRVMDLVGIDAPWGVRIELVTGLARAAAPYASALVAGGFVTAGVGFGHAVFATTAFDESHRFATEGLGLVQSDWIETELAPGLPLEVRFYHCNERHHSLALARAPFELPQVLHHLMVEVHDRDDVGRAFDRAWDAGVPIANGLGRHDNDGMFSFYASTPAGFQVEVGHGARLITDGWADNRRYHRISTWGHQPLLEPLDRQGPPA